MPRIGQASKPWHNGHLNDYEPTQRWHTDHATPAQREALRKRGYEPPNGVTKGEAGHLLSLATQRQREFLDRRGIEVDGMDFERATELISQIAANEGWGERRDDPVYPTDIPF